MSSCSATAGRRAPLGSEAAHRQLRHLVVHEGEERERRRIQRNQRGTGLSGVKPLATLDREPILSAVAGLLPARRGSRASAEATTSPAFRLPS
jgi:hypothetical protein